MRLFVILACVLLAACETPGAISSADSMMRIDLDDWPEITRDLEFAPYQRREEWNWPNGGLYMTRIEARRYFPKNWAEPDDLVEQMAEWGVSVPADFDRRSVRADENANGPFHYTVIRSGNENCFFMLQDIPYEVGPYYEQPDSAEASAGFVSVYHCANIATSLAKLEGRGLAFSRALVRKW